MIADTSAIIAILLGEPECPVFVDLLRRESRRALSAGTWIELSVVLSRRFKSEAFGQLDAIMSLLDIMIVPVSPLQAQIGADAYRRFGRGSGSAAKLNYGDCFSYALAIEADEPLLFKGDDFVHTDVRRAI